MNIVLVVTKHEWWERLIVAAGHSLWIGAVIAGFVWVVTKGVDSARARHNLTLCGVLLTVLLPLWILLQPGYAVSGPTSTDHEVPAMLAALWVAASAGLMTLVAIRMVGLARLKCEGDSRLDEAMWRGSSIQGLAQTVHGAVSDRIMTPAATSQRVLMPRHCLSELDEKELDAVVAHEIAHIARRDFAVNIALNVAEAVLFFNPFLWYLTARVRVERELCCDDEAVEKTGDRLHYARALAKLSCGRELHPALAVAMADARVSNRIRRLNQPRPRQQGFLVPSLAAVAALALLGVGLGRTLQENHLLGWTEDKPRILTKTKRLITHAPTHKVQAFTSVSSSSSSEGQLSYEVRIETDTLLINDRAPH